MPALVPTDHSARVVWLGFQPVPVEKLVITAQPNVMNSLEKVIDKLDIRRPQVLVEAIIAEVQDGNGLDLGVQWTGKHGGVQFGSTGLPISRAFK